jgi:hypothetical protein
LSGFPPWPRKSPKSNNSFSGHQSVGLSRLPCDAESPWLLPRAVR